MNNVDEIYSSGSASHRAGAFSIRQQWHDDTTSAPSLKDTSKSFVLKNTSAMATKKAALSKFNQAYIVLLKPPLNSYCSQFSSLFIVKSRHAFAVTWYLHFWQAKSLLWQFAADRQMQQDRRQLATATCHASWSFFRMKSIRTTWSLEPTVARKAKLSQIEEGRDKSDKLNQGHELVWRAAEFNGRLRPQHGSKALPFTGSS